MSEISFEGKEPFQEFLEWKEKTGRQGSGGPSGDPVSNNTPDLRYRYISGCQLREEFKRPKLQKLLDAVFAGSEKDAPDADTILADYLRPFLILVLLGHGRGRLILHFLKHAALEDKRLPFQELPHGFPKSVDEPDLFAAFCKLQWQFCPVELKFNMRQVLCSDHILPLQYEKTLAGGGSAVTYKIKVDAEYNRLEHPDPRKWVRHDPRLRSVLLTEYKDTLEENRDIYVIKSYQTEEAQEYYDRECGGFRKLKHNPNIIGFYGNFMWDNSRNIILEYADRGTLEDYMRKYDRPYHVRDFGQVWGNYLSILHGLITIHGEEGIPGKKEIMLGWHQDLNPKNILVKSGKTALPYDCHFKIADLGLSHFERSIGIQDPTAKDLYGTFAYRPPETCRLDPDVQSWKLKVKQSIDMWAFACVSSEFATWVALGYNKVEEYRYQRGIEFRDSTGEPGQCFHDLDRVLNAVDENHKEISDNHGKTDGLTPRLTEHVIQDIMQADKEARPSAKQIYDRCNRILKKFSAAEKLTTDVETGPSGLGLPLLPARNIAHGWPTTQTRSLRFRDYDASRDLNDQFGTPLGIDQDIDEFHTQTLLQHNTNCDSDDQPRHEDAETQVNRSLNQPHPALEMPLQSSPRSSNIPIQAQDSSLPNGTAEMILQNGNSPHRRQSPRLSLSDALESKRRYENGEPPYVSPPHAKLVNMLKDRDHVFVIDLGKSMAKHRPLMTNWLQVLGYTAQNADPDSLDVYCTGNFTKSKAKTYSDLLKLFEHSSFVEDPHPNVPKILARLFEDYQNKLGKRHLFRPLFGLMPKRGPRKMSIYVLTDGDWGLQNDLKTQIRSLVDGLWKYHMVDKQIGIQLLRFGNDVGGIKNLEELDSGLGLPLDLVDTEPAEGGDVFKAMLGPVDENYDGD